MRIRALQENKGEGISPYFLSFACSWVVALGGAGVVSRVVAPREGVLTLDCTRFWHRSRLRCGNLAVDTAEWRRGQWVLVRK